MVKQKNEKLRSANTENTGVKSLSIKQGAEKFAQCN